MVSFCFIFAFYVYFVYKFLETENTFGKIFFFIPRELYKNIFATRNKIVTKLVKQSKGREKKLVRKYRESSEKVMREVARGSTIRK